MSKLNYRRLGTCRGHCGAVVRLDFSRDGRFLQSNDTAREILYWEVATAKQVSLNLHLYAPPRSFIIHMLTDGCRDRDLMMHSNLSLSLSRLHHLYLYQPTYKAP